MAQNLQEISEHAKTGVKRSVEIIQEFVAKKHLEDRDVRLLIDKILVAKTDEIGAYGVPKLVVTVKWATPSMYHEILHP